MELRRSSNASNIDRNIVIQIQDLKVWTPEEKSWWRRKITKHKTVILDNVSGFIREGELIAVIGPSGAGKTTFLVSLAGKCTLPSEGAVTVRGGNVKEASVEIVPQFEVFMEGLSVMEHLRFMTEMKLGRWTELSNRTYVDSLLSDLKLGPLVDTPINSLSGGERKLLSLATTLLSDPQILVCDEPTTGLDSYNAQLVIGALKKLATAGKIVVCSIHQPSYDLFQEFSSIMLMAEGKLLFHGTHDECRELFESINCHCPKNYNPAEFYIRAVSSQTGECVKEILENVQEQLHEKTSISPSNIHQKKFVITKRNWFRQIHLLLWRTSLTLKREIRNHLVQLFVCVMASSLVLGTCYIGVTGTTQRGIQDIRGFLWLITSEVSFGLSYNALYVFEYEMTLFRREAGVYSCSAYLVARMMNFIPRCIVWPIVLVFLATLAVELPNHALTTLEITVTLILCAVASMAYGVGMAALFTSTGIMGDVMPCADLPLFLMSGAFMRLTSLPHWMNFLKYISHFYYSMDAVSNVYWRQIDHIDCPRDTTTICTKDGAAVLQENGYSANFILQDGIGLLLVTALWSLIGYIGLKREERKGYAY